MLPIDTVDFDVVDEDQKNFILILVGRVWISRNTVNNAVVIWTFNGRGGNYGSLPFFTLLGGTSFCY